ncbi:DUF2934 domain-containing protein [Polyangium aurulentum]|uniref:DUF2934 domain-containing protein n=1 Tax=Polyangium aurulentum TaxID=2567896 RepID=UPI0010ADB53C|nr:DUF2934 domain-containing protein [Polyangium aurulentum]UQA55816.1 DUF2934 domain-containing protein [Polyangium aurulentum]
MKAKAKKAAPQKKTPTRQTAALAAREVPVELPQVTEAPAPVPAPIANDVSSIAAPVALVEPVAAVEPAAAEDTAPPASSERPRISSEERRRLIALAAYQRAERLGLGRTNPVEDWLAAEREVDAKLAQGTI